MMIQNNILIDPDQGECLFTLKRKTRPNVPNYSGASYTKDAFERAIVEYKKSNGGLLYLAPISFVTGKEYDEETVRYLNDNIYVKFHHPHPKYDYVVGTIESWDDYSITFKYIPTDTNRELSKYITDSSFVSMRYIADSHTKLYDDIRIIALDTGVIPVEELGIDVDALLDI